MIRVLIVDDDQLIRTGLAMIIGSAPDIRVVGEAADGSTVLPEIARTRPDVVLMDIRMPVVDGLQATRAVAALPNPPHVLVLTTFHLDEYVFGALEAGAAGFMLKDTPPTDLVEAVRVVAEGKAMLSPGDTRRLIDRFTGSGRLAQQDDAHRRLTGLTARELAVARAVAEGLSNLDIAQVLYCSEATVKAHLTHIFTKTDCGNRVRLALLVRDAALDA